MSIKNKFKKIATVKAIALVSFASAVSAGGGVPSVSLTQTVGTDIGMCAATSFITVNFGDSVDFCYTILNDGDESFDLHSLNTSEFGALLSNVPQFLGSGDSLSINDVRTLSSDVLNEATWTAVQSPPPPTVTLLSGGFNDISGTGSPLALGDDGEAGVTMPFTFNYFGVDSADITVGANGAAIFGTLTGIVDFNPLPLPTADIAIIAPFWQDFDTATTPGEQYFEAVGLAPNREFIVQWDQMGVWQGTSGEDVTFQLALYEGTNEIQFRYLDTIFGGSEAGSDQGAVASIGIDSGDGITAIQYSLDGSTPVVDGDTVSFAPALGGGLSASDSSTAAVAVLVPQIAVNPGAVDAAVDSGGIGSEVVAINNTGTGLLEWTANEASAPAALTFPESAYSPVVQANQSYLPAPIQRKVEKSSPQSFKLGVSGTLAYGVDLIAGQLFSTDLSAPNTSSDLGVVAESFFSGDFVDGDFSQLYGIVFDNTADDILSTISTVDGTVTAIGPLLVQSGDPLTENFSGISQDLTTGTVYAIATNGAISNLYTVDLDTPAATFVAEITNSTLAIDMAISTSGQIYVHDIGTDSIVAVDKVTGEGTVIGATGFDANFAQGMAFDLSTNTLYLAAFNNGPAQDYELRSVDLNTGATTLLGSIPNQNEVGAFGVAADPDSCFLDEDIAWVDLDTTSGAVGGGDSDDVTVSFDASGLVDGIYEASICVFSNDPDNSLVKVPVTLQVGPDDLIFADGFEPPAP